MLSDGPSMIWRSKSLPAFETSYGTLYYDEVTTYGGHSGRYLRWEWATVGVVVVAEAPAGLLLIPAYRYPIGEWSLELPRGAVHLDEDLVEAARRELREETGLLARDLSRIGTLHPDTGLISTPVAVFHATDFETVNAQTEPFEPISTPLWVSVASFWDQVSRGELRCSISISAVALWSARKVS